MRRFGCLFAICAIIFCLCPVSVNAVELDIKAKSACLMDIETGTVLYEMNSHQALPPASVTKVMTMLLVMEAIDEGLIAMTDLVTASEAAAAKGGSQIYLKVGESMTVEEMLKSVAVSSANDCAFVSHHSTKAGSKTFMVLLPAKVVLPPLELFVPISLP